MKKTIIGILILTSLIFAENSKSTFKRADDIQKGYERNISFSGRISNINDYREYTRISIRTEKNGYITVHYNKKINKKEGDRISGSCSKYDYGTWINCFLR